MAIAARPSRSLPGVRASCDRGGGGPLLFSKAVKVPHQTIQKIMHSNLIAINSILDRHFRIDNSGTQLNCDTRGQCGGAACMVKSYLRYEALGTFGLVVGHEASPAALFDEDGKLAISAACENVVLWDTRRGTERTTWRGERSEVTCLARGHGDRASLVAVGYADGVIRLWSLETNTYSIVFTGHRGAVTSLAFDATCSRLASGGKDTCVILWDVLSEQGLFRLRGHKDMVTGLIFVGDGRYVISSSKDNLIKAWDLEAQHCVETLVGHRGEVWSITASPDEKTLYAGCADGIIHVWKMDVDRLSDSISRVPRVNISGDLEDADADADADDKEMRACTLFGTLNRQGSTERVLTIKVDPSGRHLFCQGADRTVEIFRILDEAETRKKMLRKRRRRREKATAAANKAQDDAHDDDDDEPDADEEDVTLTATDLIVTMGSVRASAKIRSVDVRAVDNGKKYSLLCALHNNTLEMHSVVPDGKIFSAELQTAVELPGHRTDVRTVAISSDDQMLASASSGTTRAGIMYGIMCGIRDHVWDLDIMNEIMYGIMCVIMCEVEWREKQCQFAVCTCCCIIVVHGQLCCKCISFVSLCTSYHHV